MRSKIVFAVAGIALSMGSQFAVAGDAIRAANNQITLSSGIQKMDYRELDQTGLTGTDTLDTEKGNQSGVALSISVQGDALIPDGFLQVEGAYFKGKTNYDGYLQSGSTLTPYKTTSDLETTDVAVKLGKGFTFGNRREFQATPYATVGSYRWIRDSSSDPYGYKETYKHAYAGGGLMFQVELNQRTVVKADYMISRMINPKMDSDLNGATYNLGKSNIQQFTVGLDYAVNRQLHVSAEYRNMQFKYGESPTVSGYYEPASETRRDLFFIGAGMAFN